MAIPPLHLLTPPATTIDPCPDSAPQQIDCIPEASGDIRSVPLPFPGGALAPTPLGTPCTTLMDQMRWTHPDAMREHRYCTCYSFHGDY